MFLRSLHDATVTLGVKTAEKAEVFRALLDSLPEKRFSAEQKDRFVKLLLKREDLGTTAVGDQLALPHAFIGELEAPLVVLGVSSEGIDCGALDGDLVHVFFLVLLPDSELGREAKREIFQKALILFSDRFTRQQLRQAATCQEALEILRRECLTSVVSPAAAL